MPDYFDTAARLAQERGKGIEQGFGTLGQGMMGAAQGMQTQNMLKQFGIIKDVEQPYSIAEIKKYAEDKTGQPFKINSTMSEVDQAKAAHQLLQGIGLQMPKRTITEVDLDRAAKLGASYKPDMFGGTAEIKPSPKTEYDKYMMQQRQEAHTEKKSAEQDKIENQAISRVTGIRGDMSIRNIEAQRDSTILAYRTLKDAKKEGRLPTQFEYADLLGQLWKARTGGVPTDQVMQELNTPNIEQNMRKLYTYMTGDPSSGISSQKIVNALTSFVENTGNQLDKMHESYMQTHLIKPEGLDEKRWANIVKTNRGMNFSEMQDEAPKMDMGSQVLNQAGMGGGTRGGLKSGSVEDGYKFKGGDPADPKNWEKQ